MKDELPPAGDQPPLASRFTAYVQYLEALGDKQSLFIAFQKKVGLKIERGTRSPNSAPGLFFKHCGHRDKVVYFHWNVYDPWTIVSVSDDVETPSRGGTLQVLVILNWEGAFHRQKSTQPRYYF